MGKAMEVILIASFSSPSTCKHLTESVTVRFWPPKLRLTKFSWGKLNICIPTS